MRNGFWLGFVLLAVHLAVCGGLWLLARTRALEVEGYFIPVMLLVPLWGPLCVLLLHTSNRLTGGCLREQTLEKLRINEEIHKNILVMENEGEDTVVPLEEALLVNSPAQKRKLILSVLTDDPAGYYDLLQQARMDNDSEVVHYASTALSQITMESLGGRRSCTLECRLADVQLSLAEYDRAEKTLEDLTARWPQREKPWVLRLQLAAALRDGAAIQKTLCQIEEKEVYLSAKGREIVRLWQGEQQ